MENVAHVVLLAWIVIIPLLFTRMDKRRAVLIALIVGWLFLPQLQLFASWHEVPQPLAIPPFFLTKTNAICYGLLIALVLYDPARLRSFRLHWFDLPILLMLVAPVCSTVSNDLKITVLIMETFQTVLVWGVPYLVGRLYFADAEGVRVLSIGLLLGAIAYIPFCLVEVRLSPEIHYWLWGFHQHDPRQSVRGSLYRPMVFLEHGLAVGMWMAGMTLVGFWMWWTRALDEVKWVPGMKPLPLGAVLVVLLGTCVVMGSAGALGLGLAGAGVLVLSRWLPLPVPLIGLMALAPLYCLGRTSAAATQPTGYLNSSRNAEELTVLDRRMMEKPLFGFSTLTGNELHDLQESMLNKDRADSFMIRLIMEDRLMEKALEQPIFGWGGQGRSRVTDPSGKDIIIADGMWIIMFGDRGLFGITALCLVMLIPAARMIWTYPQRLWSHPLLAPAAALAVVQVLVLIDDLSNAMFNLLFVVANGAVSGMIGEALVQPSPAVLESFATETAEVQDEQALTEDELPGVLRRRLPSGPRRQG